MQNNRYTTGQNQDGMESRFMIRDGILGNSHFSRSFFFLSFQKVVSFPKMQHSSRTFAGYVTKFART